MLSVLASGTLVADPVERTARTGRAYTTCSMRCPTDEDAILISLIAFSDSARQALLPLRKGDAASIVGTAKLSSWEKDGEQKHGLSVIASQVLTAYMVEKRRSRTQADKSAEPEQARAAQSAAALALMAPCGGVAEMADDLPF